MLSEGLYKLISGDAGVQALLGTSTTRSDQTSGIFPSIAPEEATLPYIVYLQSARNVIMSEQGVNRLQEARFRFSCYGASYISGKKVAEAVKAVLDGFTGVLPDTAATVVENTIPITEVDLSEPIFRGTVYSSHLDFYFWFLDSGS